jgi:integrase
VLHDPQLITSRSFRTSCATLLNRFGGVKDIQAHLRHASPDLTAAVYMQPIPESVRAAVKALDAQLFSDLVTFGHTKKGSYEC